VDSIAPIISAIASALGTLFGWFDPTRSEAAQKLADAVVKMLAVFVDGLASIIKNVADAIITFGGALTEQTGAVAGFAEGLSSVVEYFTGILENVGFVGEKITEVVGGLLDMQNTFEEVFGGLGEIVGSAVYAIVDAFDGLISQLPGKMGEISGILENSGFGQLMSILDGTFVSDLNEDIKNFGESAWDFITGGFKGYEEARRSDVTSDIYDARKTITPEQSTAARVTEEAVNAVIQSSQQGGGKTANINLNVDGRTVASAVYDPLKDIIRQKGAK
jgi:hypothetical protein